MPDQAVESARALARSVGWEIGHQESVARIALALFDSTGDMHVLPRDARRLLECAALVHDIGFAAGRSKHHKTSAAMIAQSGIGGLDARELALVGAIARYHRKALPSPNHRPYAAFGSSDKRLVRWCAALLRVADGLDRAHDDAVTAVEIAVSDDELTIAVRCRGDCEADLWGGGRKTDLLERECGRRVRLVAVR